jgi:DNA-binding protein H-NS
MNILTKANEIVFERNEEKERQYGPFIEGMMESAKIASLMSKKEITTTDMFNCMIALKLSRQSYNHKEDNLLDAVAYMAALNEYKNAFTAREVITIKK